MARFKPTRFMAEDSKYNKKTADYANIIKPKKNSHYQRCGFFFILKNINNM